MTEQADQLHHDNAPAHSTTALVQACLAKHHIIQVCQPPYSPDVTPCNFWLFAIEREEICEHDGHTVHKPIQRHITAD
jgi:hypothetical protein